MLRAFRYVYRWFEYILSFVCAITNDISLLAVEVVQESAVTKGEDMLEPFRSFDSGLDGGSSSSLLLPGNGGDRLKQVAEYQPSEDSDQSWLIYTVITPILVIILYSINILHILLAHFCADIRVTSMTDTKVSYLTWMILGLISKDQSKLFQAWNKGLKLGCL